MKVDSKYYKCDNCGNISSVLYCVALIKVFLNDKFFKHIPMKGDVKYLGDWSEFDIDTLCENTLRKESIDPFSRDISYDITGCHLYCHKCNASLEVSDC